MKRVLQFSGVISALLGIVALILMMATPALRISGDFILFKTQYDLPGTAAIFGGTDYEWKLAVLGLLGWILALVGVVVVLCGVILPLLKVKGIEKFAGLMNLVAVACLVVAGVFMFLVIPSFAGANFDGHTDGLSIGAGWVIGGILAIAAGAFAILPMAADFLGKKK